MATVRLGVDSRPAVAGAKQYSAAMRRDVIGSSKAAAGSVAGVDARMKELGATAASVKGALGPVFGAFAAVGIVRDATKTIAGFEETLATLQGVTGLDALSDDFQALEERSRELGATTRFSAQEAAEGLLFLSRAGFTAEQSLAAIGPTLDLAVAGALDLGDAADFASNIVSQFGLSAEDTARVVDTLVNSANSANTDVRQMAEALKFAGPVAGALGRSVEETAAAIGVLGDSGIQASLAGTNLRGILLALAKPSKEAQAIFERLGVDITKLNPETNSLAEITQTLASAQLSAADASGIFGRRNAAAALVLANGAEKVRELTAANEESAGVARENAAIIENTLSGAFRSLRSAIEELFLSAGDAGLLSVLKEVVITITGAVRILAGMEDAVTQNKDAAMLLASALKGIGIALAALAVGKVVGLFLTLAKAIATSVGSVRALSAAFATNPIGLIALAIGLAITAYDQLKDRTVEIGDETVTVGDIIGGIWDHIKDRFIFVVDTISTLWTKLTGFLGNAWEKVSSFIVEKVEDVTKFFGIDWSDVLDFALDLFKFFANNAIALIRSVGVTVGEILSAIKRAGEALLDFDITSPIESFQKIGRELDPKRIIGNIGERVGEEFSRDFVGEFLDALPGAQQRIARELDGFFGEGFSEDLNRFFNPAAQVDDIRRRALERARERAASRSSDAGTDEEERKRLADQLKNINAELAKLDTQSDVNVNVNVDGVGQLTDDAREARSEIEQLFAELEFEATLVGKSNEERQKAIALREFESLAIKGQVEDLEALRQKFGELFDAAQDKGQLGTERLAENFGQLGEALTNVLNDAFSKERLETLARDLSDTFTTAIGEVIDGTKSLDEAFEDIIRGVQQAFLENFLLKPLQGIFDNLFNSVLQGALGGISLAFKDGDAFSNGRPHFFNRGSVFSSPVTFPLRGGGTGVAGEAGPEAILPLERDNEGRLGVRSQGGSGNVEQNDNRQFNMRFVFPNARNADDFRPARRQVVRDFKRSTDGERVD
jgi:TP901 family phage tail tape measure protein